ncbi:MAG TPA: transposase [Candidatus Saccharimonadia bacterium]|nr:transposase [Candidatus Saccharimonadia bacterium]
MSIVAPKGRKHLSADALFGLVRRSFANIADDRGGDVEIPLPDALLSAFAMFSLKSPSLLAFDTQRVEGNVETIYGIQHAPCDTSMRERLDPVLPESLRPSFKRVFGPLQRGKALAEMVCLDGHYLLALDGTGYFSSKTIHCASCLHKVHRNGSITYYHQMLGAAIIHPDWHAVMPLMPEPIVQQDGTAKNDGERNAAKRFIAKLRQDHPHLKFIVTEDSLSSNAPHIETLHDYGCHSILGVKEGDHAYLFSQVQTAEHAGRVTSYERHDRTTGVVHRFRFVNDVPLHASRADVRVHVIEDWEIGQDQVPHCSWVTDLRVSKRNVSKLMRGGRARWKIDNETFNTLKHQGDNFEHHYGHGEQHLSVVFATLMLLAFLVDQTQQLCCALCQAVWAKLGSKRLLWERMRALFYDYRLASMRALFEALLYGIEQHRPLLTIDTS